MTIPTLSPETRDRLGAALDWTVLSIGIISLSIAISATLLGHTGTLDAGNTAETTVERQTG